MHARFSVIQPLLHTSYTSCHQRSGSGHLHRYRLDGSLFDLTRLTAKTKTLERLLLEALFADDCALMAHNEHHLQVIVDVFYEAAKHFGLTISLQQDRGPSPACTSDPSSTALYHHRWHSAKECRVIQITYLGSTISNDGTLDREITNRVQKASQAFGRLRIKILQHKNISLSTKLKVYNATVLPSLLYGCESWTLYRRHLRKLKQFHTRSLRSNMQIRWQDRVSNQEVLERASTISMETMVLKAQLHWTGHVIGMDESRIPRQLFYGELSQGRCNQGWPKKRYKDNLKSNLKWAGIQPKELETAAANRSGWRATVQKAARKFELDHRLYIAAARNRHKRAAKDPITTGGTPCPICVCASDFILQSHMRVHCWHLFISTCSFQLQLMASNHQLILCFANVILEFDWQPIIILLKWQAGHCALFIIKAPNVSYPACLPSLLWDLLDICS